MINWHRLFGLSLKDFFTRSPFDVEVEIDLSVKRQFLDIVILRRHSGQMNELLPDGLENIATYNLITYKSAHEALDSWTIDELLGHTVSYLTTEWREQRWPTTGKTSVETSPKSICMS